MSQPAELAARRPIGRLSPEVAAKIAAGEVVERPASVVKELVENALDAGARHVEISIDAGGLERIQVADDGRGIPGEEVELAFARHATSKLRGADELERLRTLGFRGEALPSIAAVADVTLTTRAEGEPVGTVVRYAGARLMERRPAPRQPGTTVTVDELFSELPARRKFVRSASAEAAQVLQTVSHLALAWPEVAFRLRAHGQVTLQTEGDGQTRTAALAVLGRRFALTAVEIGPHQVVAEGGEIVATIAGLGGPADLHKGTRASIYFVVNRRVVQCRALSRAVEEVYQTAVPTGRFPMALILLDVPPHEIDVNVHPTKAEIRLLRERELYGRLRTTVRAAFPGWAASAVDGEEMVASHLDLGSVGPRVIGQAHGTYIVAEGVRGMYLVDQHAAHERVLLERMLRRLEGDARQALLEPVLVPLPGGGREASGVVEGLAALGFEAEPFDGQVLLRAVPAALAGRDAHQVLGSVFEQLSQSGAADWRSALAAEIACHAAIRAGDPLGFEDMQELLRQLGEADLCQVCAHGRPTAILLSLDHLAAQFARS
ncbi:MAG: DNA mismatch repair endonuclease MutL [Chloroflexi bacterium]|nr:DNA mismatch repair endonuclease MutL [Chloroflexota bacterium]